MYEWIGITGTLLILAAFLCNGEKKIRMLDAIGAMAFVVYGWMTKTWSTVALNAILICIQGWKIYGIRRKGKV